MCFMNYEHKNEDSSFSLAFSLRGKEGSVLNYVTLVGLGAPPGLAGKNSSAELITRAAEKTYWTE